MADFEVEDLVSSLNVNIKKEKYENQFERQSW